MYIPDYAQLSRSWHSLNRSNRPKMADADKPKSIFNEFESKAIKHLREKYPNIKKSVKKKTFTEFIKDVKFWYTTTTYPDQKVKMKKILLGLKSFQDKKYENFPFKFN